MNRLLTSLLIVISLFFLLQPVTYAAPSSGLQCCSSYLFGLINVCDSCRPAGQVSCSGGSQPKACTGNFSAPVAPTYTPIPTPTSLPNLTQIPVNGGYGQTRQHVGEESRVYDDTSEKNLILPNAVNPEDVKHEPEVPDTNTTDILFPTADTYVASGRPNEGNATRRTLWVGYNDTDGYLVERSLLKFDVSTIPRGSLIQSANLRLYLGATTPGAAPMPIAVYRINSSSWPETITWNQHLQLSWNATPAATTTVGGQFTGYTWDLTALVQSANTAGQSELSLLLRGDESSGQHERAFWSKECSASDCNGRYSVLQITYLVPVPTCAPPLPPVFSGYTNIGTSLDVANRCGHSSVVKCTNGSGITGPTWNWTNPNPGGNCEVTSTKVFKNGVWSGPTPAPAILSYSAGDLLNHQCYAVTAKYSNRKGEGSYFPPQWVEVDRSVPHPSSATLSCAYVSGAIGQERFNAGFEFTPVVDDGCAGIHATNPYHTQMSTQNGFPSGENTREWNDQSLSHTFPNLPQGSVVRARVSVSDKIGNNSGQKYASNNLLLLNCSHCSGCPNTIPTNTPTRTPTPTPTVTPTPTMSTLSNCSGISGLWHITSIVRQGNFDNMSLMVYGSFPGITHCGLNQLNGTSHYFVDVVGPTEGNGGAQGEIQYYRNIAGNTDIYTASEDMISLKPKTYIDEYGHWFVNGGYTLAIAYCTSYALDGNCVPAAQGGLPSWRLTNSFGFNISILAPTPSPTRTPTSTSTSTPTHSPTPTVTPSITNSPTPTASNTPSPTKTPTLTPTPTQIPLPTLVLAGSRCVYNTNINGSLEIRWLAPVIAGNLTVSEYQVQVIRITPGAPIPVPNDVGYSDCGANPNVNCPSGNYTGIGPSVTSVFIPRTVLAGPTPTPLNFSNQDYFAIVRYKASDNRYSEWSYDTSNLTNGLLACSSNYCPGGRTPQPSVSLECSSNASPRIVVQGQPSVDYFRSSEPWFAVANGKKCVYYGSSYGVVGYWPCKKLSSARALTDSSSNPHPPNPWSPGEAGATYWGKINSSAQLVEDTSLIPDTTYYYRAQREGGECPSFPVAINFTCGEDANPQPISARQTVPASPTLRRLCIFNWCF